MNDTKKRNESKGSPEQSGGPLGSTLINLLEDLTELFSTTDPTALDPEEFTNEMLAFLSGVRPLVGADGEKSYFAKRCALFLVENLSLAAHRDKGFGEMPQEHASVLDAVTKKIQAVRTSLSGEPTVESLAQVERDVNEFIRKSKESSELIKKIILPSR